MLKQAVLGNFQWKLKDTFQVADFDFGQADEEELQYKSFWERLRESFSEFVTECFMSYAAVIAIVIVIDIFPL